MSEVLITTIDNPWNPFTHYKEWHEYDTVNLGYGTAEMLARFANFSDALTEEENDAENERAIDEMIKYDPLNIYRKVTPKDFD